MDKFSYKEILLTTIKRLPESRLVSQKTKNLIEKSSFRLSKLYERNIYRNHNIPKHDLYTAYKLLKKHYDEKNQETISFFSKSKNIKKLISALNLEFDNERYCIIDTKYYLLALQIIFDESKFRGSFIPLLIRVIIENWDDYKIDLIKKKLSVFVSKDKSGNYVKMNPILNYILNVDCFSSLLLDIISHKIKFDINSNSESNILIFLAIGSYFYNSIFFHTFFIYMVTYFSRKGLIYEHYEDIESTLLNLQNTDLAKKIIPLVIKYVDNNEIVILKEKLINLSYRLIGNPSIDANWIEINSGEESETIMLKSAQKILKRWLTNKFLTIFFNNLSSSTDDDRREFWLKYVDSIIDFKILVMRKNYPFLVKMMNGIPSEYVKTKISIITNNSKYIFILKFKNKTIIEFSTTGNTALIYNNNDQKCPNINSKHYNYNDFKMTSSDPQIFRINGYHIYSMNSKGRLFHNNGWQEGMDLWIEKYLDINNYE